MPSWVVALLSVGTGTGAALVVRAWLIAKVSIWSLTADEDGRRHALALLRILKPHLLGRESIPPAGKPDEP
jgi:hypothetical protein